MNSARHPTRHVDGVRPVPAGLTLVELLVVVAILGLLAVATLPNVVLTKESRLTREAARGFSSALARAKSTALGKATFAGCSIVAPVGSRAALDVYAAQQPEVYQGDTVPAYVTIASGPTPTTRLATDAFSLQLAVSVGVAADDLIRFNGRDPWFEIDHDPVPGPAVTGTSVRFNHRGSASGAVETFGLSEHTTPWPALPPARNTFEVLRRPFRTGSPTPLPTGRCIDLRWSGFGPATVAAHSQYQPRSGAAFTGFPAGSEVFIMFDGAGRLRQLSVRSSAGTSSYTITGAIFLLVGRADRTANPVIAFPIDDSVGVNWQHPDSFWIAIDPTSGQARIAECKPIVDLSMYGSLDYADACVDSQQAIRQALQTGGR